MNSSPPPLPPRKPAKSALDYRAPTPPAASRRVIDASVTFTCVCAAIAVTVVLLFVVPMVERVFQDFKTQLPASTVVLLWFSRFCRGGGILLVWSALMVPPFVAPMIDPPREEG